MCQPEADVEGHPGDHTLLASRILDTPCKPLFHRVDSNVQLPPGILVRGTPGDIARHFASIALLQPVCAVAQGVHCAPRAAPDLATAGARTCPLPQDPLPRVPGWPDPPSLTVGRWYIRSPRHLPAPPGFDELLQVPGEGFGAWPHPTTQMCLEALARVPAGPALDLGCGSGLLSQAWAAIGGPVTAVDIDPRAIAHARASLASAQTVHPVTLETAPIRSILPGARAPVVLANVPPDVHLEIAAGIGPDAQVVVVSGVRTAQAAPVLEGYRRLGFGTCASAASGVWGCWVLRRCADPAGRGADPAQVTSSGGSGS